MQPDVSNMLRNFNSFACRDKAANIKCRTLPPYCNWKYSNFLSNSQTLSPVKGFNRTESSVANVLAFCCPFVSLLALYGILLHVGIVIEWYVSLLAVATLRVVTVIMLFFLKCASCPRICVRSMSAFTPRRIRAFCATLPTPRKSAAASRARSGPWESSFTLIVLLLTETALFN